MTIIVSPSKPSTEPYDFAEARYRCSHILPYTYSQVCSLIPVPTPKIDTLAVDEWCRVYYNPDLVGKWPLHEFALAIEHEALHVLMRHCDRAKEYLGAQPKKWELEYWNWAADFCVNETLKQAGQQIPQDWLLPSRFKQAKLPPNQTVEQYYELLVQAARDEAEKGPSGPPEPDGLPNPFLGGDGSGEGQGEQGSQSGGDSSGQGDQDGQDGQSGGGSGDQQEQGSAGQPGAGGGGSAADGQERPWEVGEPEQSGVAGLNEFERTMIERVTAQKIEKHQKEKGTVPGQLERFAQEILHPKVDPFREIYSQTKHATAVKPGRGLYTWKRMARRQPAGGLRLPAAYRPEPLVLVVVDTSGSMSEEDLGKALGMIELGTRHLSAGNLRVMSGDTEARSVQKVFRRVDKIDLLGGGGTDMGKLVDQAAAQVPPPDAILVVTDGFTEWTAEKPDMKVVVVLTETEPDCYPIPDWMTKIELGR